MIFSQENRPFLQTEFPKMSNSEISKLLGERWKLLHPNKKKIYREKAENLKLEQQKNSSNKSSPCEKRAREEEEEVEEEKEKFPLAKRIKIEQSKMISPDYKPCPELDIEDISRDISARLLYLENDLFGDVSRDLFGDVSLDFLDSYLEANSPLNISAPFPSNVF